MAEVNDDTADYGDGEVRARVAADYSDLIDEVPEAEPARLVGKARPQVIYANHVERLTRGHLLEILKVKDLPLFDDAEWISDSEALFFFADSATCQQVLAGLTAGFEGVPPEHDKQPGIWRARRNVMEFRQATSEDTAPLGYKKQHRSGRRAREFREWAAAHPDLDLSDDGDRKRPRDDETSQTEASQDEEVERPAKRARFDLLEQMASLDKTILEASPSKDRNEPDLKFKGRSLKNWWGWARTESSRSRQGSSDRQSQSHQSNSWRPRSTWDSDDHSWSDTDSMRQSFGIDDEERIRRQKRSERFRPFNFAKDET